MAAGKDFKANISVVDKASATLNKINARFASLNKTIALGKKPFNDLAANYSKFTKLTGVDKISSGMASVARTGLDAFRSVSRIVEPLAAITGAASIAGMYKLATSWADFGTAIGNASTRAGLLPQQLMAIENAGRLAGVSAESVASGMTTFRDQMDLIGAGRGSTEVVQMMQAMFGPNVREMARGWATDTTGGLEAWANSIASIKDPTLQAERATAGFGAAGEQMLPFLRRGAAGIKEYLDITRRYGVVNADGVGKLNDLRVAQTKLQLAVEGLGSRLAVRLSQPLSELLTRFSEWIATSPAVQHGIDALGDGIERFAKYLEGVDWAGWGTSIQNFALEAEHVVDSLGGWKPVLEGLVVFMTGVWLLKTLAPIAQVALALAMLPKKAATATKEAELALGAGGGGGAFSFLGKAAGIVGLEMASVDGADYLAGNAAVDDSVRNSHGALGKYLYDNHSSLRAMDNYFHGNRNVQAAKPVNQAQWRTDMAQLTGYGWSREQAAGILGNIQQESGGDEHAVGDSGKAAGLGQWHADRQADFLHLFGHDISKGTHAEQLQFYDWELHNTEKAAGDRLKQQKTAFDSASVIRQYDERPGNANGTEDAIRGANANNMLSLAPALNLPDNAGTAANPSGGSAPITTAGTLDVNINHKNAPPGTTLSAIQSGVGLGDLKVSRSGVGVGSTGELVPG